MNDDVAEKVSIFKLAYRIQTPKCDTGPRISTSQAQFCRNLQLNEQNNNCAESERKKLFEERCEGHTWAPTDAQAFVTATATLVCTAKAPGSYTSTQKLTDEQIVLPHEHFFAVISATSDSVNIKMLKTYPVGEAVIEGSDSLRIKRSFTLSLPDKSGEVTCTRN